MEKLIVIGLDGFEPTLLEKWRTELPNFNSIMGEGVFSRLKSTTPIGSGPSWTSFTTGKNPWNHDIYDLHKGDGTPSSAKEIREARVWNYLNEAGLKTGMVNIPVTYPPEKIDGFLISSLLTPLDSENFVYPSSLKESLPNPNPKFENVGEVKDKETVKKALDSIYDTTRKRKDNILWLMENRKWEFLSFNLRGPDRIAHKCWHLIDENHPCYLEELAEEFGNVIKDYYVYLDEIIGEFKDKITPETNIMIISDHGTGPDYMADGPFKNAKLELLKLFVRGPSRKRKDLLNQFVQKIIPRKGKSRTGQRKAVSTGGHRFYGVFLGHGQDFRENVTFDDLAIVDLAPVILHLFGLPVPRDMDGKVIKKLFREDSDAYLRNVEFRAPKTFKKDFLEEKSTEEDEDKIRERLSDLGYL